MDKSVEDKLFFLDKIDFDVIVDFGCANGALLSVIEKRKPNVKIIGYDLDTTMLDSARSYLSKEVLLTNNWNEVLNELSKYENPLLNLSSVIHEVYSYSNSKTIKDFWTTRAFNENFEYIVIRDMLPSSKIDNIDPREFKEDVDRVKEIFDPYYLKSFETQWGSLYDSYRTFIHLLLKYRYTNNWEREVNENYVPVSSETIKTKIPHDYKIIYEDHFVLPFIQGKVVEDFGIKIRYPSHSKFIIQKQ
jgi:23S rRNA U2552 (ribose-2'-O)-methylase RlmE/FtsJ